MKNRSEAFLIALIILITGSSSYGQHSAAEATTVRQTEVGVESQSKDAVIITGARFSYRLVQQWIDDFNKVFPDIQVIIESRGSSDPREFDILAEVYEHDDEKKKERTYLYVARYAVVPVATSTSLFAKTYSARGLNDKLIKQIFFYNIFADKEEEEKIKVPFTVYTRFQKAGAPKVFAEFYGFNQKDILGKAIAGSDEHLLKAILRDSTGVSHLPLPVVYESVTRDKLNGIKILPIDLDGNGRVKDEERLAFESVGSLVDKIQNDKNPHLPVAYLHLSLQKDKASPNAITFLKWVAKNGSAYVNEFGFLKPDSERIETTSLEFSSNNETD